MDSIPIDIVLEICSRLPTKSIARCRFVSKLWESIFCRPDFTESFLTMSSSRPRLLFAIQEVQNSDWFFFSSPQPHNLYENKASLVVAADFHLKHSKDMSWLHFCGYASGLICCCNRKWISEEKEDRVHVICNPSTGQCASLPKLRTNRESRSFLGFDPIDKEFKVLSTADYRILTLRTMNKSWRKIQCSFSHYPYSDAICINGVLYYLAHIEEDSSSVIVCFDVRSETYKFIESEGPYAKLINYMGKLCGIRFGGRWGTIKLHVWILEDAEKLECSTYDYTLHDDKFYVDSSEYFVAGVTATGEIVLSMKDTSQPFYVIYYNPKRNTLQGVEIKGFGDEFNAGNNEVYVFVDHVEALETTSSRAHMEQDRGIRFESINQFDALHLVDDD
ncbi:hypothetical protein EUTSA_v10009439mg [Eutrema salsugineum]|uniref:F-box domain-containing protein n=1 Tax=Eutrema salsugineum TaxID=72664 RepID=V4MPL3_EUTSA|nr:F-box protein At1g31080 [Eutrema salsugineum]ESQ33556.1 hypothetical protein EUTSA_v10009439mg [Eutrema salsugineum]